MAEVPQTQPYTVCAAFRDSDTRATVVVHAISMENACQKAIALVDGGHVTTTIESYDPGPTFIYGVVPGEDQDPFAGCQNVPDTYVEDAHLHQPYRALLTAARSLVAAGQARMPSPVQSKAYDALKAALEALATPHGDDSVVVPADTLPGEPTLPATEDEFLAGPGRGALALVIDDRMAKRFGAIWNAIEKDDEDALTLGRDAQITVSEVDPAYRFATCAAGVQLLDGHGISVGGYLNGDLALDEAHRGRGLGRELVLEFFLRFHGLPTWDHDKPAFSRLGEKAHRSAYRLAQDSEGLARRRRRITG